MRTILLMLVLTMLSACTHKLPVCQSNAVVTDKWSAPCRSADEVDTETGALDLTDPTDLKDD